MLASGRFPEDKLLTRRLLRKILRPLAWVYYRFCFGGRGAVVRALAAATELWERLSERGDTPLPGPEWDAQYSRGRWSRLGDPQEAARYGAIAGLARGRGELTSVLDVGCGEGLLRSYLASQDALRYLGLDVSQAAIDRARERALPGDRFECADAESYLPGRSFSAVILNESLYYFRQPLAQAHRYLALVEPGGVMVISMFESPRTLAILRQIEKELPVLDSLRIKGQRGSWRLVSLRRPEG